MKILLIFFITFLTTYTNSNTLKCDEGGSTVKIAQCFSDELIEQEKVLDAVLKQASKNNARIFQKIQESHNIWLNYRKKHCNAIYASYDTGSMRLIAHPSCMLDMTRQRIQTIQDSFLTY